jgi:DNA polymerase III subunit beta
MKIQVSVDILQKKLSFINHGVSPKSQLPVLQNVLLEAYNNKLKLSSTDLEIGIETQFPVAIEEEGGITVPTKTFTELISSLPFETITLETKDTSLVVQSKKTRSVFQTISKDEFPKLYEDKGVLLAKIKTANLREDISSVVFAASQDTTKPALSGILVKPDQEGFLLVATDGYRLSLKRHPVASVTRLEASPSDASMIIPARIFKELLGIKEDGEDISMFISRDSNQVVFEAGETLLVGRLIEAVFPNYERIIPLDFSARASFHREEMLKAVKICSIFARDSANIIKLSLKKEAIVVSSQAAAIGENTVTVESSLKGEENEIAFNGKYLLDILGNIQEETILFEMTGPLNPGVFKVENDESFLHLIMPIRVQV